MNGDAMADARRYPKEPSLADMLAGLTRSLDQIQAELERRRSTSLEISAWMKWAGGIIASLIVASIIGAHAMIWSLNDRLTTIETGEFTASQAAAMEARIVSRIDRFPVYMETLEDHEARIRALEQKKGGGDDQQH